MQHFAAELQLFLGLFFFAILSLLKIHKKLPWISCLFESFNLVIKNNFNISQAFFTIQKREKIEETLNSKKKAILKKILRFFIKQSSKNSNRFLIKQ